MAPQVAEGDFAPWNELKARGHYVMPHGYRHANKAELPLAEATRLIEACLDVFRAELAGFDPAEASFAFPYNRSTPELEAWLAGRVRAFRTRGDPVMPLPAPAATGDLRRLPRSAVTTSLQDGRVLSGRGPGLALLQRPRARRRRLGPLGSDTLDRLLGDLVARTFACSRSLPRSTWPSPDGDPGALPRQIVLQSRRRPDLGRRLAAPLLGRHPREPHLPLRLR